MNHSKCKYCKDEICVNADCPMRADYCPVFDTPQICRYADMEFEFELPITALKMDGDKAVGLITPSGFTFEFHDKDGNLIPLNKKGVEEFLKRTSQKKGETNGAKEN